MHLTNGMPAAQLSHAAWRKATKSYDKDWHDCVELAPIDGLVAVRNSRHPAGPALIYTRSEIAAFIDGAKNGEFDDLT